MADNKKLSLKPINDLLGDNFFIPAYQRGYRWTTRQVRELLDDIWEFRLNNENTDKDVFYCLQPVVVVKHNDYWEVVDGQQRLTTIKLILHFLKDGLSFLGKDNTFSIEYETRNQSKCFLQNINFEQKEECVDYYHICNAYKEITDWFTNKGGTTRINFLTTLLNDNESGKNVKVIWYDLSEECEGVNNYAIDVFTRINIGKIPLTNAELIKALFLGKIKYDDADHRHLKRLQIASEWDSIESTLQKEDFWHFIYSGSNKYDTRIEYIFDLMKNKYYDDEVYFTFHKFNEVFDNESQSIDEIWLEIKNYFQRFRDWFNNRELYHYVGYLITTGNNICDLIEHSKSNSKNEFKEFLIKRIKRDLNLQADSLDELEYGDKKLNKLLLLFNIQTIVSNSASLDRFPFHFFKNDKWEIEHIRSIAENVPGGKTERNLWLDVILQYFIGMHKTEQEISDAINILSDNDERNICQSIFNLKQNGFNDDDFFDIYNIAIEYFHETETHNKNSLANLTLLNQDINRSYKNAPFSVKRKTILDKIKNGTFVPLCTKNVFLKAYNTKFDNLMYWQTGNESGHDDGKQYLDAIKDTLKDFLDNGSNGEIE